uniref:Uncharacterized protein n=1 Tax=viral metagenome TaxID=1070528 RepID=A0A6C0LER6_9ZZZZ
MISSYRLGDLVLLHLSEWEKNEILSDYPQSIGSKYIIKKRERCDVENIDLITQIVMDNIEKYSHLLPKNITESTVIHLRLGDVIAGNEWHEKGKRPLKTDYLKSLVAEDMNPKYVIGKCFFAKTSSKNYEECISASNEYLNNVITELQAEYFDSGNADIDLYCAVKSKIFIQGKGYFSKLIVEIRKRLNLYCIETAVND